jgi:P27 family predicted phage terminase small subunit
MPRKAKPTSLKILEGNPGQRKLNKAEPKPRAVMPDPPAHLCPVGVKAWHRVSDGLHYMGVLGDVDRDALAAYCTSYALWKKAWDAINEATNEDLSSGLIIKTTNGNVIQNPLVGIANKAAADMVKYASEFGMTPSARARLSVGPKDKPEDNKLKGLLYKSK